VAILEYVKKYMIWNTFIEWIRITSFWNIHGLTSWNEDIDILQWKTKQYPPKDNDILQWKTKQYSSKDNDILQGQKKKWSVHVYMEKSVWKWHEKYAMEIKMTRDKKA
jgi:hypothetical protein